MERFLNNLEDSLAEEQGFSTVGVALALLLSLRAHLQRRTRLRDRIGIGRYPKRG